MKFYLILVPAFSALLARASQCPFALERRSSGVVGDDGFLDQFVVNDTNTFTTTDFGTPVDDTTSLKAGERGPTLMEDFVMRTKITRFDHERVPERVVHARGAGAHGYFESYGDWSNITAAAFLSEVGKQTPIFVRFSVVGGARGSADNARDVHGFALRFYTEEGNYDIVGNNIPVFFVQDAIQFPDVIHATKPSPDSETQNTHDRAYDFFAQNPAALHTFLWQLAGSGIPRSYRHMDGFGVNTYRFVNDNGDSKLVKFHFKTQQGRASLIWPEAVALAGQNPDAHRTDLFGAIASGNYPEWELSVQIVDEEDVTRFGFDLLDPTKIIPETIVPLTPIGKFVLNRNPINYFAETEQVMFCPGHIVRRIDFSDDPLLQGRLFSYLDTQLNRHMGSPNFEQIPINRPRSIVHNNNRDGAGQQFIQSNAAYSFNSLNNGSPPPANQTQGRGFFTAPARRVVDAKYVREVPPTFLDHWSQPRLFWNSILPVEQQMIVDALRFELANVESVEVRTNFIGQINLVDHDLAVRVAGTVGIDAPAPDPTYYHDNTTTGLSIFNDTLSTIAGLNAGILATSNSSDSISQARDLAHSLMGKGANGIVIAEKLGDGVNTTYTSSDAALFDGIIIMDGTQELFNPKATSHSSLYPPLRPLNIVRDAFYYGKAIYVIREGSVALDQAGIDKDRPGVRVVDHVNSVFVELFESDLKRFKFVDRYPIDQDW
ncbi:hypothetical protein VKT23_000121 [Stygiomarasmius scandens]|uniref:Catalase n=1 Tax=Marasmiellus scandens TaxID=2682957 RepID=A0ABR1K3F4_9AGAR